MPITSLDDISFVLNNMYYYIYGFSKAIEISSSNITIPLIAGLTGAILTHLFATHRDKTRDRRDQKAKEFEELQRDFSYCTIRAAEANEALLYIIDYFQTHGKSFLRFNEGRKNFHAKKSQVKIFLETAIPYKHPRPIREIDRTSRFLSIKELTIISAYQFETTKLEEIISARNKEVERLREREASQELAKFIYGETAFSDETDISLLTSEAMKVASTLTGLASAVYTIYIQQAICLKSHGVAKHGKNIGNYIYNYPAATLPNAFLGVSPTDTLIRLHKWEPRTLETQLKFFGEGITPSPEDQKKFNLSIEQHKVTISKLMAWHLGSIAK